MVYWWFTGGLLIGQRLLDDGLLMVDEGLMWLMKDGEYVIVHVAKPWLVYHAVMTSVMGGQ